MTLRPFQSGLMPCGHFDFRDSQISSINGGEIVVFDIPETEISDNSSPDVYTGSSRTQVRLATELDTGPFFLVDADRNFGALSEVSLENTSMFSAAAPYIQTINSSGKYALWPSEGFYAVTSDVIDTDTINVNTEPNTRLYVGESGFITATPSASAAIIGFFIEYREKSVSNAQLFNLVGTDRLNDTIILYKANADGYLNLNIAAIAEAIHDLGDYRVVSTIAARNAIQSSTRKNGLLVKVIANGIVYILGSGLSNSDWDIYTYGMRNPNDMDIYVNILSGNDENDGYAATPKKTIQHAIYCMLPPHLGSPYWERGDNRTINVVYQAGISSVMEMVEVPYHTGEAILYIKGEEEMAYSGLIQSGAIAAISGFECRKRLTITTSGLASGVLADGYFVRLANVDVLEANAYQRGWEDLPIVNNTTNTLDIDAFDPGVFSAFHYGNGAILNIVRPRLTWTYPAAVTESSTGLDFAAGAPLIYNHGAPLVVSGFIFQCQLDTTNILDRTVLFNVGLGDEAGGSPAILNRCITIGAGDGSGRQFWSITTGNCSIYSCIVKDSPIYLTRNSHDAFHLNIRIIGVAIVCKHVSGNLLGFDAQLTNFIQFENCPNILYAGDHRGGNLIITDTHCLLIAYTAISVGALAAIQVGSLTAAERGSALSLYDGTRISGSTGNTNVGCTIGVLSSVANASASAPTLSGAGGNIKVGNLAAQAWATGPTTDTSILCRYHK